MAESSTGADSVATAGAVAPRVLVVDDERFMRLQVRQVLQREGFEVFEAETGGDALARLDSVRPDLVLVDGLMPDMDGVDCCRRILATPGYAHLPVLMITGLDDRASIDQAFAAGALDFVTKPVQWDVLRHRLRRALERSRLQVKLESATEALSRLAVLDGLTQLPNRRHFDQTLVREWRRGARAGAALSLLLVDVDDFRGYIDAVGEIEGDACLQRIAAGIVGTLRRGGDFAARFSETCFAVLLPDTGEAGARLLAEQLIDAVDALRLPHAGEPGTRVSVSIGAASAAAVGRGAPSRLLTTAAEALHAARQGTEGRLAWRSVPLPAARE